MCFKIPTEKYTMERRVNVIILSIAPMKITQKRNIYVVSKISMDCTCEL